MAFYTSRLDSAGNEIERREPSERGTARPDTYAPVQRPGASCRRNPLSFSGRNRGFDESTASYKKGGIATLGVEKKAVVKNITYRKNTPSSVDNEIKHLPKHSPQPSLRQQHSTGAIRKGSYDDNKSRAPVQDFDWLDNTDSVSQISLGSHYSCDWDVHPSYDNSGACIDGTEDELDSISTSGLVKNISYRLKGPSIVDGEKSIVQPSRKLTTGVYQVIRRTRNQVDQQAHQKWLANKKNLRSFELQQKKALAEEKKRELEDHEKKCHDGHICKSSDNSGASIDSTDDELDSISTSDPVKNITYRVKSSSVVESEMRELPRGRKGASASSIKQPKAYYEDEDITDQTFIEPTRKRPIGVYRSNTERHPTINMREQVDPDEAYQRWLANKKKLRSDQLNQKKVLEEQKKREVEDRKKKCQEKYDLWLQSKAAKQREPPKILSNRQPVKPKPHIYDEKSRSATLQQWEQKKRQEEAKRRAAEREKQKRAADLEEQRRAMAANAWEEWKADAASKPKPVPLGQGMFTLRGTVSKMFVNPNKWQKIIPSDEDDE